MIPCILAIEAALWATKSLREQPSLLLWRDTGRDSRSPEAREADVILLGDSMIRCGLVPEILEAKTGRKTVTLALTGGRPSAALLLLNRVLEQGGAPSVVVIDFEPLILINSPYSAWTAWYELLEPRDVFDFGQWMHDPSFPASFSLGHAFLSIRHRQLFEGQFKAFVENGDWLHSLATAETVATPPVLSHGTPARAPASVHTQPLNDGGHHSLKIDVNQEPAEFASTNPANSLGELLPPLPRTVEFQLTSLSPGATNKLEAKAVIKLLRLTRDQKIALYIAIPPRGAELEKHLDDHGLAAWRDRFHDSLLREFPHVRVIDSRHAGYSDLLFSDSSHVNHAGAQAWSRDFAATLARELTSPGHEARRIVLDRSSTMRTEAIAERPGQGPRR
jgi:lysophospholipase L1-like esterase